MIKNKKIFASLLSTSLLFVIPSMSYSQDNLLKNNVEKVLKNSKGVIGISIAGIENKDSYSFNGKKHFPMQSVFKFPIAMAVLDQVDKGKLSLDQKIHINKSDYYNTYSPIKDKYPNGNIDLKLSEILGYTVSKSDNIGCDILIKKVGGAEKINSYIHSLGVTGMQIKASEYQMSQAWDVQYTNWSEPEAMTQLLNILYSGKALSKSSNQFLMTVMKNTTTGPNRIRGLLPKTAVVAHKTGTSGINKGIASATNDVGIVTLPNGKHFSIVAFVSDSPDTEKNREAVIAKVAKLAWDYFSKK